MSIVFLEENNNLKMTVDGMSFVMPNKTDTEENRLLAKEQACLLWHLQRDREMPTGDVWREETYMNGSTEKVEYMVSTTQGQSIVDQLETTWPDEVENYQSQSNNLVAEFGPDREPYQNDSISWYSLSEEPSESYKTSFSLPYSSYSTYHGHGLKFDKITQEVKAKIAVEKDTLLAAYPNILDNAPLPEFWNMYFCARIHSKDGSVDDRIDVYQFCPPSLMKEWCDENGHTFPYDITNSNITNNINFFSVVINTNTNTVEYVKAYARFFE